MSEKKDFWMIDVTKEVSMKVVFDEPVTADEALELFNNEEYADILDEDVMYQEAVGITSPDSEPKYFQGEEEGDE